MNKTAVVRFTFEGWHGWPDAPAHRNYLKHSHRHLFHVEVELDQLAGDREVEFHDLLDQARIPVQSPLGASKHFGRSSCEDLATVIATYVRRRWPARRVAVAVFEDNECGARMAWGPDERIEP